MHLLMRTRNAVQYTKIHERDEKLTRGKSIGELQSPDPLPLPIEPDAFG